VESSCEFGNEPLGSVKCWETIEWLHNWWPLVLSSIELVRITSYFQYVVLNSKMAVNDEFGRVERKIVVACLWHLGQGSNLVPPSV
jgi:hypothetical protein